MNIGQLDGQPLALQIFNGMTAESTCVNERWAKDQLFRCVCFAGGRHQTILDETVGPIFQSTSSVWRTTGRRKCCRSPRRISIHVLRVEDDFDYLRDNMATSKFQSTSSMWRTTSSRTFMCATSQFQSTSSMWRTTRNLSAGSCGYNISIHVLHVEDDTPRPRCRRPRTYFNPRPPCGGRQISRRLQRGMAYFNPRPPCGGRQRKSGSRQPARSISIHVLRAEDDGKASTARPTDTISIHVLRAEDDRKEASNGGDADYFNPRPPCGGRHQAILDETVGPIFQSTSSVWRTTRPLLL